MTPEMLIARFDAWLRDDGPVAVVVREPLEPVQGPQSVFFPPTFAPPNKGEPPYYVIDETSEGKTVIVDTVGSQANRLEPIFKNPPYASLVPRAVIRIGERTVNILEAGHRAADAVVRFSDKRAVLHEAFAALVEHGDATPLAKLAPTSLVFGAWDSRDTQAKIPRLVGSTIRAFKVETLTRAAQFFSAFEKSETDELNLPQDYLSEQGLSDAPAGRTVGGVIARGGIVREAVLNLVALRALRGADAEATLALQRYVLGLALVVLFAPPDLYLREGCLLVGVEGQPACAKTVSRNGARTDLALDQAGALEFATAAVQAFGVGESWEASFDSRMVLDEAKAKREAKAAKAKKAAKS